jgi:hypothetical protein
LENGVRGTKAQGQKRILLAKTPMTPISKLIYCENGTLLKTIFRFYVITLKIGSIFYRNRKILKFK